MGTSERVIILGFDGLDPRLCRRWMQEGRMPHFTRLAASGAFRDLNTSVPCQSPVAWRTVATGVNPGKHGVFDFLRKQPGTYYPIPATVEKGEMPILPETWKRAGLGVGAGAVAGLGAFGATRKKTFSRRAFLGLVLGAPIAAAGTSALMNWIPTSVPLPLNRTQGTPFWGTLGERGIRSTVLRMPVEFPPRDYRNARVLAGLTVPDLRGTNGTYTIFSSAATTEEDSEMGGRLARLEKDGNGYRGTLLGPPDPLSKTKAPLFVPVRIAAESNRARITCCGESFTLSTGEWSPWIMLTFDTSPVLSVHGKARFHLLECNGTLRLYVSPIQFDPASLPPNVRISSPASYAETLAERHGFFQTLGWPTDTWSLTEEQVSDEVYLHDLQDTMQMEERVTLGELERNDWDTLMAVFTTTDQVQHVFSPFAASERAASTQMAYEYADAILGKVMKRCGNKATIIVLSDHGFQPFEKAVNINTWLWRHGYLRLKDKATSSQKCLRDLYHGGLFWENVDWSETYAYSMGLGNIYLNQRGREPEGVVREGDMANLVLRKLGEGLLAFKDPQTSAPVVRSVYYGKDLYAGAEAKHAADVVVGFQPGYRVSWQTALGGVPEEMVEPNTRKWAADHCSLDPAVTPGILLTNRKLKTSGTGAARPAGGGAWPSVMDVAPSVLHAMGLNAAAEMEGDSWWA